jgi:hypothetical protein
MYARFSLRTSWVVVTLLAVAIVLIANYSKVLIAVVIVILWFIDKVIQSGFVEAWPELQGPRISNHINLRKLLIPVRGRPSRLPATAMRSRRRLANERFLSSRRVEAPITVARLYLCAH